MVGTTPYLGAIIVGGRDPDEYEVVVPPSLFYFVTVAADGDDSVELVVEDDGDPRVGVVGRGGSLFVDGQPVGVPDVRPYIDTAFDVMGRVRLTAATLYNFADSSRRRFESMANGDDPNEGPSFWLDIGEEGLMSTVIGPDAGLSRGTVAVEATDGSVSIRLDPSQLQRITQVFPPDETVDLLVPRLAGEPVRLLGATTRALLMPFRSDALVLQLAIEETIEQTCGHLAVGRDPDGDYPLMRRRFPVFARLVHDAEPPTLQVFAVLLTDVATTPELLSELNDQNSSLGFARLFIVDGQVLAEVDLVASSLDPAELRTAIDRILDVAERMVSTLATFFGGEVTDDPSEARWRLYRTTVVEAEAIPGQLMPLNGANAVEAWPFPGAIHALTGWNPQGVQHTDEWNDEVNARIAADVLSMGARFVHGHGRSPSGDHAEPSLIVWGLSRDDSRELGRRAAQDAIFEIDADKVHLISCFDSRVENWVRRG